VFPHWEPPLATALFEDGSPVTRCTHWISFGARAERLTAAKKEACEKVRKGDSPCFRTGLPSKHSLVSEIWATHNTLQALDQLR
jgi:hypothetical protein